jgi:DNA invertase Pin-like site-specific DNA recombinase
MADPPLDRSQMSALKPVAGQGRPAQCERCWATKIDRLARSTSDLYPIISELAEKDVAFRVVDDPTIDTTSRTGKLVMRILALIAEFENDIRRERQMDGIAKAKERGVHFGRKLELTAEKIAEIKSLRQSGIRVPEIMHKTNLSKATVYRALA